MGGKWAIKHFWQVAELFSLILSQCCAPKYSQTVSLLTLTPQPRDEDAPIGWNFKYPCQQRSDATAATERNVLGHTRST